MRRLVEALCASERPESIFTWKRSPKVQALPMTHDGLDTQEVLDVVAVARALLVHHGLRRLTGGEGAELPQRDGYLARFDTWIQGKLAPLPRHVAQPVEQFATWHHLNRMRAKAAAGRPTQGPVPAASSR